MTENVIGSSLGISLFAYRCLRYHLADGSIMNPQIIRKLFGNEEFPLTAFYPPIKELLIFQGLTL